jgi:F0F1-type ATP synthase assembly protein I
MSAIRKNLAKKAAKAAAKHTARGTASKLKRDPMRAAGLLGLGGVVGAAAGWMAARTAAASVNTGS